MFALRAERLRAGCFVYAWLKSGFLQGGHQECRNPSGAACKKRFNQGYPMRLPSRSSSMCRVLDGVGQHIAQSCQSTLSICRETRSAQPPPPTPPDQSLDLRRFPAASSHETVYDLPLESHNYTERLQSQGANSQHSSYSICTIRSKAILLRSKPSKCRM